MKKEYDFSKGERAKFYYPDVELDIPVYLESDISEYLSIIASGKKVNISDIVNDWLRKNIALIQSAHSNS